MAVKFVRDGQTESMWSMLRAHEYPVIESIRYSLLSSVVFGVDVDTFDHNFQSEEAAKLVDVPTNTVSPKYGKDVVG